MENNSILQKLDGLEARFEEVSTLITDPDVIADQNRFVKLTKEYKDLGDIMDARKRYIACLNSISEAKDILAYELTNLVHGEEEAARAREASRALFGGGGDDSDMPAAELTQEDLSDGSIDIMTMMVKAGVVKSKSEARQNVLQGGVSVDGEKITDIKAAFSGEQLKEGVILKKGKKTFKKITLV